DMASHGTLDTEPDIFYFNVLGRTGKFFFDHMGDLHLVPYQKIKITSTFDSWAFITEDGTKFTFTKKERTKPYTTCNGEPTQSVYAFTSAWYLTEIQPVNTEGKITLEYETYGGEQQFYEYWTVTSSTRYRLLEQSGTVWQGGMSNSDCMTRVTLFNAAQLKKIESSSFFVEFDYGAERCDLKGNYMLENIRYKRKNSDGTLALIKEFELKHKYLEGKHLVDINAPCVPTDTFFDMIDYS